MQRGTMQMINGYPIYISDHVDNKTVIPNRRHRRRRIQKKWTKRFGYKVVVEPVVLKTRSGFIMSQWSYDLLRRQLQE